LRRGARLLLLVVAIGMTGGCVVATVASTAVSVTATVVETTADVVGGAVDLVIPDGDED
jgi:hypothetical protein